MGCCVSNDNAENFIKDPIKELANDISLEALESKFIDEKIKNHSKKNMISPSSFNFLMEDLKLDYKKLENFFDNFKDGYYYRSQKLSALGVLVGIGTVQEKITILFKNYRNPSNDFLTKKEASRMISDIIDIACIDIPSHCVSLYPSRSFIAEYSNKLNSFSRFLKDYYRDLIMKKEKKISFINFKHTFDDRTVFMLLDDKALRYSSYKLCIKVLAISENNTPKSYKSDKNTPKSYKNDYNTPEINKRDYNTL